jgi:murein DD-endopeptidase MepM/ murein hydrolase activator NlpD
VHIILISDRLTTTKNIVLDWRHMVAAATAAIVLIVAGVFLFSWLAVRYAAENQMPFLQGMVEATTAKNNRASDQQANEKLAAMAIRLGEMQAQLSRLDSLGERLASSTGIRMQDLGPAIGPGKDARGGPVIAPVSLSMDDLTQAINHLSQQIEGKADVMSLMENRLLDERIRRGKLPTALPLDSSWNASSFGLRIDPITGQLDMHPGVDFPAEIGTPIKAAAAGVVINVENNPGYGNMVDVDHGNGLVTRYAHCSKILVGPGALVKRGQLLAEVGSTGRSTGPHLHFEVRINGVPQNPNHFLEVARGQSGKPAQVARIAQVDKAAQPVLPSSE